MYLIYLILIYLYSANADYIKIFVQSSFRSN